MATDKVKRSDQSKVTVSHILGEIVWLLGQSKLHRDITAGQMNWLIMPPIIHRQFHIFREGECPIGVALWATLDEGGERKVMRGLRETGERMSDADWTAGDRLWLVELVAPFSSSGNRHAELMMGDLVTGPFSNKSFKMLTMNPQTGISEVMSLPANLGHTFVEKTAQILRETDAC
jgi:cytolysin-activating lysine-acyltransferase